MTSDTQRYYAPTGGHPPQTQLTTDRAVFTQWLRRAGHEVLEADNAEDGLQLVREQVPQLVLMDEPLGALDALTRLEMQELIVSLWQEHGFTVLLVTHDVSEAVAMADRVLLIEDGKIGLDLTVDIARPRRIGSVRLTELEAEVLNRVMQRGDNEVQLRKQG